jgi:diaminohydroxyphosphoribosylaminopyrimidine deaminase/5-amino-6-(5-phosphoribosylamino)uracil reductase
MSEPGAADAAHMERALELAARGLDTTDPNPRVGCVLVHGGQVVGEGWHERSGEAHAEVRALAAAGAAARGATAYVTLEPCAGAGRTPPCVGALLAAGVARVVYAAADANPRMRGGAQQLREAGIDVHAGLLEARARALNPGFHSRQERGRPWVRVKLGMSLDGRTALADGASRWITGPEARADGQRWRARSSVVLTGVGTITADDPALNVRIDGSTRQPLRVVLDSRLRTPPGSRVFTREGQALVLATAAGMDAARRAALERANARIEVLAADAAGQVSLDAVLARLAALEANEVWVEAGATLAGSFLRQGLADELVVYVAPSLLGPQSRPMALLPGLASLEDRVRLEFIDVERIGADLRIIARPVAAGAGQPAGVR